MRSNSTAGTTAAVQYYDSSTVVSTALYGHCALVARLVTPTSRYTEVPGWNLGKKRHFDCFSASAKTAREREYVQSDDLSTALDVQYNSTITRRNNEQIRDATAKLR